MEDGDLRPPDPGHEPELVAGEPIDRPRHDGLRHEKPSAPLFSRRVEKTEHRITVTVVDMEKRSFRIAGKARQPRARHPDFRPGNDYVGTVCDLDIIGPGKRLQRAPPDHGIAAQRCDGQTRDRPCAWRRPTPRWSTGGTPSDSVPEENVAACHDGRGNSLRNNERGSPADVGDQQIAERDQCVAQRPARTGGADRPEPTFISAIH